MNGPREVWQGEAGILPGVVFFFGQTEDLVNPYPLSSSEPLSAQPGYAP